MKYYIVWLDKNIPGQDSDKEVVEFEDDATEDEIEKECADCLDTMIGNHLDTGWDEIDEEEAKKIRGDG